jgi:serine/threonine protein kinase
MSSSKRHFTVVINSKEHGLYVSSTPSSAARKAVSKLCADNKKKKVEFYMRETTKGSNKKVYGPYIGYMQKLEKPIELEGWIIQYKPIAKLKKKSHKMKGGGEIIGEGGEGIVFCPNIINNRENRVSKVVRGRSRTKFEISSIDMIRPFEEKLNEIDREGIYHVPMINVKAFEEKNKNKLNGPLKERFDATHIIITYDYGGISLTDFLKRNESEFKIDITKEFYKNLLLGFVNIFEGLIIFNQNGIFHHDLSPSNILFRKEDPKNMRLIDFEPRDIFKNSVPNPNIINYNFALDLFELFEIMEKVILNKILEEKMDIIRPLLPFFYKIFTFIKSMLYDKYDYNETKSYTIQIDKIIELKDEMRRRIEAL